MKEKRNSRKFFANCDAVSRLGIKVSKWAAITLALAGSAVAISSLLADNRAKKEKREKINRLNELNKNR